MEDMAGEWESPKTKLGRKNRNKFKIKCRKSNDDENRDIQEKQDQKQVTTREAFRIAYD